MLHPKIFGVSVCLCACVCVCGEIWREVVEAAELCSCSAAVAFTCRHSRHLSCRPYWRSALHCDVHSPCAHVKQSVKSYCMHNRTMQSLFFAQLCCSFAVPQAVIGMFLVIQAKKLNLKQDKAAAIVRSGAAADALTLRAEIAAKQGRHWCDHCGHGWNHLCPGHVKCLRVCCWSWWPWLS